MNIGIIGYGVVGKAVATGFQNRCHCHIYDPNYSGTTAVEKNITFCETVDDVLENAEYIFICVPTPMKKDVPHSFDSSVMDITLQTIAQSKSTSEKHIFVIKSTVIPSKINQYIKDYPRLNFVTCPEFLLEKEALECFLNPPYRIYGGKDEHTRQVHQLFEIYSTCRPCKVAYCGPADAMLIKYMINNFLAMKVSFMNQFYDLAKSMGITTPWEKIAEIFHHDTRVGNSHAAVPGHDGQRGWGGMCFPKDVCAIINEAKVHHCVLDIMQTVWRYNHDLRDDID